MFLIPVLGTPSRPAGFRTPKDIADVAHDLTLHYVRHFGLTLVPFYADKLSS